METSQKQESCIEENWIGTATAHLSDMIGKTARKREEVQDLGRPSQEDATLLSLWKKFDKYKIAFEKYFFQIGAKYAHIGRTHVWSLFEASV